MSADDSWWEYHLTMNGWVEWDLPYGRKPKPPTDRPEGTIATWREHLSQSSIYSPTYSALTQVWKSEAHSPEEMDAIRERFKDLFKGDAPRPLDVFKRRSSSSGRPLELKNDPKGPRLGLDEPGDSR